MKREPPHDKTNKMICVPSEDSDQPGQSQRCPPEAKLGPKRPIECIAKTDQTGSTYAAHIHFITFFTFPIEPNMKSFSYANNIVFRRDIYIHSLN